MSFVSFMSRSRARGSFYLRGVLAAWMVFCAVWAAIPDVARASTADVAMDQSEGVLVKAPEIGWSRAVGLLRESGALSITTATGLPDVYLAHYNTMESAEQARTWLESQSATVWAELDSATRYAFEPGDPLFEEQIWAQSLDLPAAWNITTGQQDVTVAVVGSGVSANHPDLQGRLLPGRDILNSDDEPEDELGHGTAVAGIIAANGGDEIGIAGIAMETSILPVKVGDATGASISALSAGIVWAVDHGADIVNVSLVADTPSEALHEAVLYAYQHDVPLVAAAGNGSDAVTYPGSWPETISVGASTLWGSLAPFSTRANRVDLVAPGASVLTTWWSQAEGNGWQTVSGTSFAAPMVSGALALLLSVEPDLTIEELRGLVKSTALAMTGMPDASGAGAGAGQLDVGASLQLLLGQSFDVVWTPVDVPVERGLVDRGWMWGPQPIATGFEAYVETSRGQRLVRYYDKGRMEVTDPFKDSSDPWFVTSGLLAREMITGRIQFGDRSFTARGAAQIPIAGDADAPTAATYADLLPLLNAEPAAEGAAITTRLTNDAGRLDDPAMAQFGVVGSYLVPETNHRIASVFWDYLNRQALLLSGDELVAAPLFDPLFFTTGFPITEAYWVSVTVDGVPEDVLAQCFQRRCLTYNPANPDPWKVEMGNVGRHYYEWRYQQQAPLTENTSISLNTMQQSATLH